MIKKRAIALECLAHFIVFTAFINLHIQCISGEEDVEGVEEDVEDVETPKREQVKNCIHMEETITYKDLAHKEKRTCTESIRSSESYKKTSESWSFSMGIDVGIDVKMVGVNWGVEPAYSEETAEETKNTQYQKDKKCTKVVWSERSRQIYRVTQRRVLFTMNGKKQGAKSVSLGLFTREEYVMSINVECQLSEDQLNEMAKNHLDLHYKRLNGTIEGNKWISTPDCGQRGKKFLKKTSSLVSVMYKISN